MAPLLTFLGGLAAEWVADWRSKRENARQVEAAVTESRVRIAQSAEEHRQLWEMQAMERGDVWLRRLSFAGWTWPMVWAAIDRDAAREFFTVSLAGLPDWYVGGYLAVTGAVWGLSELRHMGVLKK